MGGSAWDRSQESGVRSQGTGDRDASSSTLRVGVLGGTFDPVHIGHLILAEEARDQLDLSIIYFVPAGDPPHKRDRHLAPVDERVRMIELAIAGNACFQVSRVDADRPGPHYTIDMVELIKGQLPLGSQLYFLMGFDSLRDLPGWHEPARLVAACHLVALTRHDIELDWGKLEAALPGIRQRVTILDMPELEIASNQIQARVRAGRSIRYLVPAAVRGYIQDKKLYSTNG
jgi:nicotinate-nucleotide adenylyltransferase